MRVFLVDNYDSFTYNLVEMLRKLGVEELIVQKNDQVVMEDVAACSHIIFSPGPGVPNDAPVMFDILKQFDQSHVILGVCLGHQAIGEYYGAGLFNLGQAIHGIKTPVTWHDSGAKLFQGLSDHFDIGLYHSWALKNDHFPTELIITAKLEETIQAIEHKTKPVYGVQFHPESIMTSNGKKMLQNFLNA